MVIQYLRIMKIALIADSEQELYVFPELIEALSAEIKDLEAREFFVPTALDIPAKCLDALDCELIFAMHLYDILGAFMEMRGFIFLKVLRDIKI